MYWYCVGFCVRIPTLLHDVPGSIARKIVAWEKTVLWKHFIVFPLILFKNSEEELASYHQLAFGIRNECY